MTRSKLIAMTILRIGVNILEKKIKNDFANSCLCDKKVKQPRVFAAKKNSCLYGKNK
jgi:hypothetical protein